MLRPKDIVASIKMEQAIQAGPSLLEQLISARHELNMTIDKLDTLKAALKKDGQLAPAQLVDQVAAAMWNAFDGVAWNFYELKEDQRNQWRDMARVAIAMLRPTEE